MFNVNLKNFCWRTVLILTLILVLSTSVMANGYKFCVSMGWVENASGQRFKYGFESAFKEFGNTDVTYTDANYDPKRQSEQIDAFIKMKPDAIFITPSNPVAIVPAVKRAIEAGIPVFASDSYIPGASVTTTVCSDGFGMGVYSAQYIVNQLNGKGEIGVIDLPAHEGWDIRYRGFQWVLKQNPGIKVVSKWSWDSTGQVTPRQAVDNMLTSHPEKGSIDAIWCAWDGAAMEGALAITSAGRDKEIFTTGIDGGKQAFEYVKSGTPFKLTMAQSVFTMSYMAVYYANQFLEGEIVPRLIIAPVYAVTKEGLEGIENSENYDMPGAAKKFGWERVN